MDVPETRYTKSGDSYIAYRVEGEGPFDVVFVSSWATSIDESEAYQPEFRDFVGELTSFARLIRFDQRGTGSSDRVVGTPTLEERMDDVRAVMDAVGSRSAAVVGVADGAAMSLLFAATFPARTFALALMRLRPRYVWAEDYPWAPTREQYEQRTTEVLNARIDGRMVELFRRNIARLGIERTDDELREEGRARRQSMPPSAFLAVRRMNMEIDVRHVLPSVTVPTLLIYRPHAADADETGDIPLMSYVQERIPHAETIEASADIEHWYTGLTEPLRDFLPRAWADYQRLQSQPQRVLATVLFTDIVASTRKAVELGPRWQELLREHNAVVRREIRRFSGREIDTAGDGFFASGFDGPARAIRCGCAIRDSIANLDLDLGIRVGLHTGECDLVDGKLSGLAVNIGARVAAQAGQGEVLVSGTVKDLVAGSGITFESRGVQELKGLGEWPLYAVAQSD